MVPGYSGRIPAYDNVFGLSYARGTESAVRDFETHQTPARRQRQRTNSLAAADSCDGGQSGLSPPPAPLWSRPGPGFHTAAGGGSYHPTSQPAESPYFMSNDDPRKYFMSGYTGFVPNTQQIGSVFPVTTNRGLRQFTDEQCRARRNLCRPVVVSTRSRDYDPPDTETRGCSQQPGRTIDVPDIGGGWDPALMVGYGPHDLSQHSPNEDFTVNRARVSPAILNQVPALGEDRLRRGMQMFRRRDPHPIYRAQEGLLPTYGGHVPNQQFRFGGTFGKETVNARSLHTV